MHLNSLKENKSILLKHASKVLTCTIIIEQDITICMNKIDLYNQSVHTFILK